MKVLIYHGTGRQSWEYETTNLNVMKIDKISF